MGTKLTGDIKLAGRVITSAKNGILTGSDWIYDYDFVTSTIDATAYAALTDDEKAAYTADGDNYVKKGAFQSAVNQQLKNAIAEAKSAIPVSFDIIEVVAALPTTGETSKIYLLKNEESQITADAYAALSETDKALYELASDGTSYILKNNEYDEYCWVTDHFEKIGSAKFNSYDADIARLEGLITAAQSAADAAQDDADTANEAIGTETTANTILYRIKTLEDGKSTTTTTAIDAEDSTKGNIAAIKTADGKSTNVYDTTAVDKKLSELNTKHSTTATTAVDSSDATKGNTVVITTDDAKATTVYDKAAVDAKESALDGRLDTLEGATHSSVAATSLGEDKGNTVVITAHGGTDSTTVYDKAAIDAMKAAESHSTIATTAVDSEDSTKGNTAVVTTDDENSATVYDKTAIDAKYQQLYDYIYPISVELSTSVSYVEQGASYSVVLTANVKKSGAAYTDAAGGTVSFKKGGTEIGTGTNKTGSVTYTDTSVDTASNGSVTYTASAYGKTSGSKTVYVTAAKRYAGSTSDVAATAFAASSKMSLTTSGTGTIPAITLGSTGGYVWYFVPSYMKQPDIDDANSVTEGGFTFPLVAGDDVVDSATGATYKSYRSASELGEGSYNVTVAIAK